MRPRDIGRPRTFPRHPKRYTIIAADPPWTFFHGGQNVHKAPNRNPKRHYGCMSLEEVCALPVASIAAPDAALFLWTTAAHLQEALQVIEAWGFKYKSHCAWIKPRMGLGANYRNQHELMLFARRGNLLAPKDYRRPLSIFEGETFRHSQKPDEAYERIERMYPGHGPRIELFARQVRPGWNRWGNEIPGGPGACPDLFENGLIG
jgi:N6-adenosine-specific RNA methylase IME4